MAKKRILLKDLEADLLERYARWKHIYEDGCCDPGWNDGTNINLVRNHIFSTKKLLEKYVGGDIQLLPDCYFYPEPPELPNRFMARDRNIANELKVKYPAEQLPYESIMKFGVHEPYGPTYGV